MANPSTIDILQALRLARRIASAIATGLTSAAAVEAMTDAEILKQFDDEAFAALEAKQKEAEDLAGVEPQA